jgi:membrane associated rhomboid family serine protease
MKSTAVKTLIIANFAVFLCQFLLGDVVELLFGLWPLQPLEGQHLFHFWQIVTYAFLHSTTQFSHILFNMLGLWMFGAEVERYAGSRRLLTCYFASVVTAALSQLFVPALLGAELGETIGASGGVFGLLLAYAYLFPKRKVIPLIPPIPMPAWLFATLYAGIELFLGFTGSQASVAHFAHLGGMIGSWLVISRWHLRYRT